MKLYKVLSVALLAMSSTLFQSCLKDQTDFFEESPSERMQATLDNARKVLTGSPEGWIFEYFPDRKLSYGGYVYTVKFDDEKATVGSEIAPGEFVSSYYKFTNDNGPMLAFDTYNSLMHYFSIPSNGKYQGMDGDYEFIIMDVTDDVVTLRGKRTGNTMHLRRLEVTAEEYLSDVTNMIDNLILTSAEGTVGSDNLSVSINTSKRYMEFSWGNGGRAEEETTAGGYYLPTPTGITFPVPVTVKGTEVASLGFDSKTLTYSGEGLSFSGEIDPDFAFFNEFEGEFAIKYNGTKTVNCTLVRDVAGKKVYIKGLNANYDVVATYDVSKGRLEINSQQIGQSGNELYWIAWVGGGYVGWGTSIGMYIVKDTENPGTYKFIDNGKWDYTVVTLRLYYFTGAVGEKPRGNIDSSRSKWYINGGNSLTNISTLVKK